MAIHFNHNNNNAVNGGKFNADMSPALVSGKKASIELTQWVQLFVAKLLDPSFKLEVAE